MQRARMAKLVDAADLKSAAPRRACGFDSRSGHHSCVQPFDTANGDGRLLQPKGQQKLERPFYFVAKVSVFAGLAA